MAGLINLLKFYSTLTSADPAALNDPAIEADRIFFDNNQPKIEQNIHQNIHQKIHQNTQQNISDSIKTKSNYKSLSSQDLEMLIWMNNPKKFEKEILRYLDENLYFGSGANIILDKTNTKTGEMKRINGDWYVSVFQVGSGYGLFADEKQNKEGQRDISTTFTSIANNANYTIEQTRKWLKDIKGLSDKELVTYVNKDGNMIDNVYKGNEKRNDLMTQKFKETQILYSYNPITGYLDYVGPKDEINNHLVFKRGKSEPVPLDLLMKTAGFDYHGKNIVWKELKGKDKEIAILNGLLNELKDDYSGKEEEFKKLQEEYFDLTNALIDEKQSHIRTKKGFSAGPLIEASYNGEKGNESVNVSYGLFTNIPFWDSGKKITLEFIYTPRNRKKTENEPVIIEDRESHPVLPITGISKVTKTSEFNKEAYDITGGIGYEVADGFTLMLYGGMRKEFENNTNSNFYETWFENNGVKYDYNSNIIQSNTNNDKNHAKLGVGGKFHLGSINLTNGIYWISNGTYEVKGGAQLDISKLFK